MWIDYNIDRKIENDNQAKFNFDPVNQIRGNNLIETRPNWYKLSHSEYKCFIIIITTTYSSD